MDDKSPSTEDIRRYWETVLKPNMQARADARPKSVGEKYITIKPRHGFIMVWVYCALLVVFTFVFGPVVMIPMIIGLFIFVLLFGVAKPKADQHVEDVKGDIGQSVKNLWGLNYSAQADGRPDIYDVLGKAHLLPTISMRFEDFVWGQRAGLNFTMNEAYTQTDNTRNFQGVLLALEWPEPVGGRVVFLPRHSKIAKVYGAYKDIRQYRLTSSVLDEKFQVFLDDPVQALSSLTTDRFEKLYEICLAQGLHDFRGLIFENQFYICFESEDRFKAQFDVSLAEREYEYFKFMNDLKFVCELVDGLGAIGQRNISS